MAAIDKLHGNTTDFAEFRMWVFIYHPELLKQMYNPFQSLMDMEPGKTVPIASFSRKQDILLLWRCPIPFVREYLERQCGLKTRWYHKFFWTNKRWAYIMTI